MTQLLSDIQPLAVWTEQLLSQGYCIIENALPARIIENLNSDLDHQFHATPFSEGLFYGEHTKRFGGLLKRSPHTSALVLHPLILSIAHEFLGKHCDQIQLNVTQAIEIHPGERRQLPHRDHDMWRGNKTGHEFLLNIIWPLSPFTKENGATLIYPGSHRLDEVSEEACLDEQPVAASCPPGSAICFLGSTAHGAGPNTSSGVRRAIVVGYCLGWLKPYENQWLTYPPEIAKSFSSELADLVGYRQHRPNLGNYEGQCPSILLHDRSTSALGAVDALRPDQQIMLNEFVHQSGARS